jgi:hypothetical protein
MQKISILVWVGISLFIVQPLLASTNICALGSRAVAMSEAQIEELYEREIEGRLLSGQGKVVRVTATSGSDEGPDGKYEVEIVCSKTVKVILQTNGFWIERFNAKKGSAVSFTGECFKIYKSMGTVYCVVRATIR